MKREGFSRFFGFFFRALAYSSRQSTASSRFVLSLAKSSTS
jgi:hypothetical protein